MAAADDQVRGGERGRRVVVTGVGMVTPLGNDVDTLLRRWLEGEVAIADGLARCEEFVPRDHVSKKEAHRSDRYVQLALAASRLAWEDAGWGDAPPVEATEVGCVVGTGFGALRTMETQHDVCRDAGARRVSPLAAPMIMHSAAVGAVAIAGGLEGPAHGVSSACATGADAVGTALRAIQAGDAEAMVAVGADACQTELAIVASANMGATSPTGTSRPFDARRDGFVIGEGAGALVLERAEVAERRGARIHGELLGFGATCDAYHLTMPEPSGATAARAVSRALAAAGAEPEDVAYVNAHGTSTPFNDRAETNAIKRALGPVAAEVPVSSTKSVIGHLIGAAGVVEAAVTLAALEAGVAPPTVGYEEPDEGLDLDYVPNRPGRLRPTRGRPLALSNSFGFGGHNAVLCLAAGGGGR
jgi:3-oxoacyl-[acyl-carrier-protein] synthase II